MPHSAPTGVDPAELKKAIEAIESRGSTTSDLPPLAPTAHEAASAALRLLRYRPRSTQELRERLLDKEFPTDAVEEALTRLRVWGLLDDAEFAREWVRGRRRRRGKSAGALERELRDKGISEVHIADALGDVDPQDEYEQAVELVAARLQRRRPETGTGPSDPLWQAERRRLVAFLERRGYPVALALRAVDVALSSG